MRKIFLILIITFLFTGCTDSTETMEAAEDNTLTYIKEEEITLNFSFGEQKGIYTGEVLNSLPHGFGSFTNGDSDNVWGYAGYWDNTGQYLVGTFKQLSEDAEDLLTYFLNFPMKEQGQVLVQLEKTISTLESNANDKVENMPQKSLA